jgi:hypothetical protein
MNEWTLFLVEKVEGKKTNLKPGRKAESYETLKKRCFLDPRSATTKYKNLHIY